LRKSTSLDVSIQGPAEDVRRFLQSIPEVANVVLTESLADGVQKLRIESKEDKDIRAIISRSVVEGGFALLTMNAIEMSLEDIFVQLVTKEEPVENG